MEDVPLHGNTPAPCRTLIDGGRRGHNCKGADGSCGGHMWCSIVHTTCTVYRCDETIHFCRTLETFQLFLSDVQSVDSLVVIVWP